MDCQRTGGGNGETGDSGKDLPSTCRAITRRSLTQTPPVQLLVESPPDPKFDDKVTDICQTYESAIETAKQFERTVCIDEMTGIQALERKATDLPMRPGEMERQEFEYIRHGTQTLIASA